jgi:rubrerythrin
MKISETHQITFSKINIETTCEHCNWEQVFQKEQHELAHFEEILQHMHCLSCKKDSNGFSAELACWSCKKDMTLMQRSENDGFCPYCNAEIELDD